MNRKEYNNARRMIRDNGRYALKWFIPTVQADMRHLFDIQDCTDQLAERADIIAYCKREGFVCNFRHLANK